MSWNRYCADVGHCLEPEPMLTKTSIFIPESFAATMPLCFSVVGEESPLLSRFGDVTVTVEDVVEDVQRVIPGGLRRDYCPKADSWTQWIYSTAI